MAKNSDLVPIPHRHGLERDPLPVLSGGNHRSLGPAFQQLRCAADVVGVVMGLQHGGQAQLPFFQPLPHRRRHGGVDHHGLRAPHPDPDHVVLEHRQGMK